MSTRRGQDGGARKGQLNAPGSGPAQLRRAQSGRARERATVAHSQPAPLRYLFSFTFSHSVRTWFSFSCLHSFSCSTHWSSSLVNALSSMAAGSPPPPSPLPAPTHPRPGRCSPLPPPPPAPSGTRESRGARPLAPRPAQAQRAAPGARPPADPRPPGRAPRESVKGAGKRAGARRGTSAQLPPDDGHSLPPTARWPLSPLLSRPFSSLPPGFRHRPGISAGKRRAGCAAARAKDARRDVAPPCGSAEKRPQRGKDSTTCSLLPLVVFPHFGCRPSSPRSFFTPFFLGTLSPP